jgi:hypothetical protein
LDRIGTAPALKEWAVAVNALAQGETILLLRKGGIREQKFALTDSRQFWLYPTYEHQKPHLLKSAYASQVRPVESGWHPQTVEIRAWAEATDGVEVESDSAVQALLPHHVWNQAFVTERLKWKPQLPLTVLLLRVYVLSQPQIIPYREAYGGCKSWIDLPIAAEFSPRTAALSDAAYQQQVQTIVSQVNASPLLMRQHHEH